MRRLFLASALLALAACDKPNSPDSSNVAQPPVATSSAAQPPAAAPTAPAPQEAGFDLNTVPVTTQDLGAFPFFEAPEGFSATSPKQLDFEQKYVYPGGHLRVVEGKYYHADVFGVGDQWNETLLVRSFDKKVAELGGAQVFDGGMPDPVKEMIRQNQPRFVGDLYDPLPYRFRQYLVRTADSSIWIELGYGYNTQMVDLTVVQEGS